MNRIRFVLPMALVVLVAALLGNRTVARGSHPAQDSPTYHYAYLPLVGRAPYCCQTKSLFIAIVDGIRDTEAFDDPEHRFIPHLWNDLRPQGTIYQNFYNHAETYTTPANQAILDGVWDFAPNTGKLPLHPLWPTVFEYYRRAHPDVPANKVWAVVGKEHTSHLNYSLHPYYGTSVGAQLSFPALEEDAVTWQRMQQVMDQYHPDLVYFHLGQVDAEGHTGDWQRYSDAIRQADTIVNALWDKIQSDPYYKDRTTLFVTTDHGRHDDAHGGFRDHGGLSEGDKRCIFLALGPDIRRGETIATPAEQTDIAPTVGALMGFPTPLVEGHVLTRMLSYDLPPSPNPSAFAIGVSEPWTTATLLSSPASPADRPVIAANQGNLYVAWTDQRTGHREIFFRRRVAGETAWTAAEQVSNSGVEARKPSIVADDKGAWVSWLDYRDGNWALFERRYLIGTGWLPEQRVLGSQLESPTATDPEMLWYPALARTAGRVISLVPVYHGLITDGRGRVQAITQSADGALLTNHTVSESGHAQLGQHHQVTAQGLSAQVYAAWNQLYADHWQVFYAHSEDEGNSWSSPTRIISERTDVVQPTLALWADGVALAWADAHTGRMQVYLRYRQGIGSWSTPLSLSNSPGGAWHPTMAASSGRLELVWEDYRDGKGNLYWRESSDGGQTWRPTTQIVQSTGFSTVPQLAADSKGVYLVWQENQRNHPPQVVFASLPLGP